MDYNIMGISKFESEGSNSKANFYGVSIVSKNLNCQGDCSSTCILKEDCSAQNGIVSGNSCTVCPSNTTYDSASHKCVSNCGVDEELVGGMCQCKFGFMKLGNTCIFRCQINQEWTGSRCLCIDNHAKINGTCRKCPVNSLPNEARTECVCSYNKVYNIFSHTCQEQVQCPLHSTLHENRQCKCDAGYFLKGNYCVPCQAPGVWNPATLSCECAKEL